MLFFFFFYNVSFFLNWSWSRHPFHRLQGNRRKPPACYGLNRDTHKKKIHLNPAYNQPRSESNDLFWLWRKLFCRDPPCVCAAVHSDFILLLNGGVPRNLILQYALTCRCTLALSGLPTVQAKVQSVRDEQEVVAGRSSSHQWGQWGSVIWGSIIPEMWQYTKMALPSCRVRTPETGSVLPLTFWQIQSDMS